MRLPIAVITAALIVSTGLAIAAPAGRLAPKDIETTFFTGQPFTASTTANVKYKMVFMADNKMTREPLGKTGAKSDGTWRLSADGYCTTWKGAKEGCYRVQASGTNKWSIISGTAAVATWTK